MIRSGVLALVLAGPAGAQTVDCNRAWDWAASVVGEAALTGTVAQEGDWCTATDVWLTMPATVSLPWHADHVRMRGSTLAWVVDGTSPPEGLEIVVQGLRLVPVTGDPRTDWLLAAQTRRMGTDAEATLAWDPKEKVLRLEGLSIDFPGENAIRASATVAGVDLSSTGAMQMSATSFAVREADLAVTTHGLFEGAPLMTLGTILLPPDGNMDAAAERLRADALALVRALPATSFSDGSKAALAALIGELPNPSGELKLSMQAEPGIGPARLTPMAIRGVPQTMDAAWPLFQGVMLDVGWTHEDAP